MEGSKNELIRILKMMRNCSSKDELLKLKTDFKNSYGVGEPSLKKQKKEVEDLSRDAGRDNQEGREEYDPPKVRRLTKRLKTLTQEVRDLVQQGSFAEGITLDVLEKGCILPVAKLAGEATARRKMKEIWDCLMDKKDVTKIGVCGMGGIGKTTVMKHIHNRLLDERIESFDRVIWVTVSKAFDVLTLQHNIALNLGLDLSRIEDATIRAAKIHEALKNTGRYLLVLDDLWERFRLEDVGIPDPTSANGCKLILTTRSVSVCNSMGFEVIQMVLLGKDEARNLFFDHVGPEVRYVENLKPIMEKVIEECARLPLAIVTVASSMRRETEASEWRSALRKLNENFKEADDKGAKVIEVLKLSYDRLQQPELKDCLRFCALYPEDAEIYERDVIPRLVDEEIIGRMQTIQEELDEGNVILNALARACLLERGTNYYNKREFVKMHDLVRDMALSLTPPFMVQAGRCSTIFPEKEKWAVDLMKVSFMENFDCEIPANLSPRCPNITTLLLCHTWLKSIPDSFFLHLHGLRILDLSGTLIQILPDSISNLQSLTALLLQNCESLWKVPSLAKLKNLEKLVLSKTRITEIPEDFENLSNLKYLDLRNTWMEKENAFPSGLLPKLPCLQSLFIDQIVKAKDLMKLDKLKRFWGCLDDMNDLSAYSKHTDSHERRIKYNIQLGLGERFGAFEPYRDFTWDPESTECDNRVYIVNRSVNMSRDVKDSCVVLKDLQSLIITECHDAASVCDVVSFDQTSRVDVLDISDCDGMTHLFTASSLLTFQSLPGLYVSGMMNLSDLIRRESASSSPLPPFTFSHLKHFCLHGCRKIEKLFSVEILCNFQNLEWFSIKYCDELREIATDSSDVDAKAVVEDENMDTFTITLPKLKKLDLCDLPELKSICPSYGVLVLESLKKMSISRCAGLERIPFPLDSHGITSLPPSIKKIKMRREVWDSPQWNHHTKRGKCSSSPIYGEVTYKFDDMSSFSGEESDKSLLAWS